MKIEGEAKAGKDLHPTDDQTIPAGLNDKALRKIRGLFAAGVTAVTTQYDGRLRGLAVSAFTSVSLDPPLVLVCISNEAETCQLIEASGIFAVNILSDDQEFLSERFAARAPIVNSSFEGVPHHSAVTGAPILEEAIAWYDCRVESIHEGGDHRIIVGRVAAIGFGDEARQPLIYYANGYKRLRE